MWRSASVLPQNDDDFGLLLIQSYAAGECFGVTESETQCSRNHDAKKAAFKWWHVSQAADDW